MSQYSIITDLNRCVGCLACEVACKVANNVAIGSFWNNVKRVGPYADKGGAGYPDVYSYYIPLTCQHCENPECVNACPTGASFKREDGVVLIDADACIGCQICISACPYGVRFLNEVTNVVEKCTLCEDKLAKGEMPACVAQCSGRARFVGDIDEGLESFIGPAFVDITGDVSYEACYLKPETATVPMLDVVRDFTDDQFYRLSDEGNAPAYGYILRNHDWKDLG